jgi:preprotein translocase subunit SecD
VSLRSRWILIAGITLVSLYFTIPSFIPEKTRLASPWIPDDAMELGLDLQGGIYWLLRIDTESAVQQELDKIKSNIVDLAEEKNLGPVTGDAKNGVLTVHAGDPAALRRLIEDDFEVVEVSQNGDAVEVRLSDKWKREVVKRGVQQALEVLRKRVDGLGVREPSISPQGSDRILVQLPGAVDAAGARELIRATTFLEFKPVLDAAPSAELLQAKLPNGVPEDQMIVVQQSAAGKETEALLVPKKPTLTGGMLEDARVNFDRRNRPIIEFQWNSEGTKIFRDFTAAHIGDRLAAIIDGKVVTAPVIQSKIGRNGQITGDFTREEAANTAVQLRSGALPIPLVIEEERVVGPSLGADSIRQGLNASILGIALVFVFAALYYSVSGVFADIALFVQVLIIIALMSLSQATLTLPGIAGIILTVGMAVDANVIIYERIREEMRAGKAGRAAVQAGFSRSFWTIFDSHVTTLASGIILILFGRGPVQGFGVTLTIGILASMFTALVVTRALIDWFYRDNLENLRI